MLRLSRKRLAVNSQQGFSLLEIVIALAIVTIGILGVMIIFPAGLRANQRAADFTTAATLGSRELQYIINQGYNALPLFLPVHRRDFDDHPNWRWSGLFIQEDIHLRQVTVSIYWTDRGEENENEKKFIIFMAP